MRPARRRLILLMMTLLLLMSAACGGAEVSPPAVTESAAGLATSTTHPAAEPSTTTSSTTSIPVGGPIGEGIEALVADGSLEVDTVSPDGGISGKILDVLLTNRSDEDLDVIVPCGLVFEPAPGVEEQRMMVIEPVEATVPAGSSVTVHPYVACIDSDEDPAGTGAAYMPAGQADGDLLSFAQCLCGRSLEDELDADMGGMDLQFAIWAVADGFLPSWSGDPEDLAGALGALTGESLDLDAEDLKELEGTQLDQIVAAMEVFMEQFGTAAQRWLDECGIDVSK